MYRKAAGEPQLVFNYARALSDFKTNFCFSKGITFKVPWAYQHITPALLDRVFTIDNNKDKFLWDIGSCGSIMGDVFIKITHEDAFFDDAGILHPAKVRLIPLNPQHSFPRWHPHDRGRLEEFKLKYKYWNTAPDGTRLVNTYVEVLTSKEIREYINDRLISQRPNPMGEIPIVHIAHRPALGSPWGLGDLTPDFLGLQREYNEKAMEISDIINYHVSPVTVITGGKPPNLQKGPAKIWGVDNDKAKVFNLEGGFAGLQPAEVSLDRIKTTMCEMQGVPVTALGQEQAISNTSGVALSIQFMPTMQQFGITEIQYSLGLKETCRLVLKTLFIFEPETVFYDPNTDGIMQEGQAPQVDPSDYRVYDIDLEWAKPLPVDVILKLQEIQLKMELGLESKKGAMRILGEEFPDEKLKELFDEQMAELKQDAAKSILNAQAAAITMALTGLVPDGYGEQQPPPPNQDGTPAAQPTPPAQQSQNLPQLPDIGGIAAAMAQSGKNMMADIVADAYGAHTTPRRDIDVNQNDTT